MRSYGVSGTDRNASSFRRRLYDMDEKAFPAEGYSARGWRGIAWSVLGWACEEDEDTEWSGCVNRTDTVLAIMVGDDRVFEFDADELEPLDREEYCGSCGQIGCAHDGLDRSEEQ